MLSDVLAHLPPSHVSSLTVQPFVVGPGFSPVPAKLVSQIFSRKFVDLSELLSAQQIQVKEIVQSNIIGTSGTKDTCKGIHSLRWHKRQPVQYNYYLKG